MDSDTLVNLLLVLAFVLIGGVFAGTEMAIVSLRESQVKRIERSGRKGARTAALVRDPNMFLSAVQIGVTVAGFFSSAYGASTIAPDLAPLLEELGLAPAAAQTTALIGMTLVIAYLSLVFGELVPKRLAMQRAEGFTRVLAPPLNLFARLMRPVIWLLSASTNAVVRLVGGDPHAAGEEVSAEEIREMVVDTRGLGPVSRSILTDVFEAGERRLAEVMRPRTEVHFLDGDLPVTEAYRAALALPHSRYPVTGRGVDDVLGFVHIRDLVVLDADGDGVIGTPPRTLRDVVRPIPFLPQTNHVLRTLHTMRAEGRHIGLVVDEYGGTAGIVTLEDLVEELVGEIYDEFDAGRREHEDTVLRRGEAVLVDGGLIIQEVPEETGLVIPEGHYETVGGFVMSRLGRVARPGDVVDEEEYRLEVLAVDGARVERVRISRRPGSTASTDTPPD
ncbi:hemolysin family protein [Kocuria flava]|uniref:hemolysin family protein n=1 Tax=Kocuria flava TaxID=446860 RepID=UPI001FF3F555|nr:hemolysin family protein [Kocuria flava]MCJ8504185.1 hemolysin family protein [Kocuria flava]